MNFMIQQYLWFKLGWTPAQWQKIKGVLGLLVILLMIDLFLGSMLFYRSWQCEQLKDEIARWQFDARHAVELEQFRRTNR